MLWCLDIHGHGHGDLEMPRIAYRKYSPRGDMKSDLSANLIIVRANQIIEEMAEQGYTLTLRQLYYQFISRGWFPENTHNMYRKLGKVVSDAREGGLIDWNAIDDRGRQCYFHSYTTTPEGVLANIERGLGLDPWEDQPTYMEAWIEKDALSMVLARACADRRIPHMACKGYLSTSEAWRAGLRFSKALEAGKRVKLIYAGDHDPSGMQMGENHEDRLLLFTRMGVEVHRVALNMDQVQQYDPPPNYAKETDSRFAGYKSRFGDLSWELDALHPKVIVDLVQEAIEPEIDVEAWDASLEREREARLPLLRLRQRWTDEVSKLVMMDEKPLERLARMDAQLAGPEPIADLLEDLAVSMQTSKKDAVEPIPGQIRALIDAQKGANRGLFTELEFTAYGGGLLVATDVVDTFKPDTQIDEKRFALVCEATRRADLLNDAMEVTPFDPPADEEVGNDYEPKDPDQEEIDDAFGDRY
jgi:hypothetical protein